MNRPTNGRDFLGDVRQSLSMVQNNGVPTGALTKAPAFPRGGFSLIELLVVMGIIALLASLILPSLANARRRGQSAACANNLHQLSVALNLYVDDNDNHLPVCAWPLPSQGTNQPPLPSITNALLPYVKSRDVFRCPADTSIFPNEHTSYEWNGWLNGASYDDPEDWSDLTKTVVDELFDGRLNTPLMGDAAAFHPAAGIWSGKNACYFDGRVQKTKKNTFSF